MLNIKLENLRKDYASQQLDEKDIPVSPFIFFEKWLNEALEAEVLEPTAMTLSTVSMDGKPSARIVLLKGIDEGFRFFTNYNSRKGKELAYNPACSLTFFWPELERQVRITGNAEKVSPSVSDEYFNSRPEDSKISAIISPQSETVPNRDYLVGLKENFNSGKRAIIRPGHWGGYSVIPESVEFWQGRPGRLHDRIIFTLVNDVWIKNRLAP